MFLDNALTISISEECYNKLETLLEKMPQVYYNKPHLIRCAIMKLYKTNKDNHFKEVLK